MPGQDKVVGGGSRCPPNSRVVPTQHADIPIGGRSAFGAGDRDHSPTVCQARDVAVDPLASALHHGATDAVDADQAVVVAGDGKDRCDPRLARQPVHSA